MKPIRHALSLATTGLLAQHGHDALALENAWELDFSFLNYSEKDRIKVSKYIAKAGGDVSDRDRVNLTAVLDTMSGATPSGAVKQSTVTFTGASGEGDGGSVETNASALAKFDDTRTALSLVWTHNHDNNWDVHYNAAVSVENDYRSYSGAITVDKATESKAFTFTAGLAGTIDQIFRVGTGDTPKPLSAIKDQIFYSEGEKDTVDAILGLTHVINRRTVAQINLSYSVSKGYMNDPYKVFSVVDSNSDKAFDSFYENRPAARRRRVLALLVNHQLFPSNHILNADYRYYSDDWEVRSHTLRINYHFNFGEHKYLETGLRFYQQSRAFFYRNEYFAVVEGNPDAPNIPDGFPQYISADYRLDDMKSVTPDIRFGMEVSSDDRLRVRLAYMFQTFRHSEFDTNQALIFQIAYNKRF